MKRFLLTIVATAALVALFAVPAVAEGYNVNDVSANNGAGQTYEGYGDEIGDYVRADGYFQGPHGGYTTTTNKCQDCHSTHYATGSYKLLRANDAAAACDYCHGGGGGSTVNIMMDNAYKAAGVDVNDGVVDLAAKPNGYGTGHTLGFKGKAPADINPAFSDTVNGLSCFSCHTPHGNSARTLQAFGSPARPAGDGEVSKIYGVSFMAANFFRIQEQMKVEFDFGDFNGFTSAGIPQGTFMHVPEALETLPFDFDGSDPVKWTGAAAEIGSVIGADPGMQAELGGVNAAFGAWLGNGMLPKAPLPADMFTWRTTPANFEGDNNGDGYAEVSDIGVGALMDLFTDGGTDYELVNLFIAWKVYWGQDLEAGNITTAFQNMGDWQVGGTDFAGNPAPGNYGIIGMPELEVWHKPLFPKGRYLLLKNPDTGDDVAVDSATGQGINEFAGMASMMGMPDGMLEASPDMAIDQFGNPSAPAGKKVGIDWEWPLGPAATWGPFFYTDNNERFPLAFPWAPRGVAMENEMCTSCHDGSAGMSKEVANVWVPDPSDPTTGTYQDAYSHDSNSRGCARAQIINSDDDNNFGPHCANCHTGASGCRTCHSEDGENWESFGRDAYDPYDYVAKSYAETSSIFVEGESSFLAPAAVRSDAIVGLNGKCLDGGFSYPHRTMGANMLKDQLWGVNFDGTPVAAGVARTTNGTLDAAVVAGGDLESFFAGGSSFESTAVIGQVAHNLDSVCIDCHGDATYYNEDAYTSFVSGNPLDDPSDGAQMWTVDGWSLLLKGLP